jgi:hypothetical protein
MIQAPSKLAVTNRFVQYLTEFLLAYMISQATSSTHHPLPKHHFINIREEIAESDPLSDLKWFGSLVIADTALRQLLPSSPNRSLLEAQGIAVALLDYIIPPSVIETQHP